MKIAVPSRVKDDPSLLLRLPLTSLGRVEISNEKNTSEQKGGRNPTLLLVFIRMLGTQQKVATPGQILSYHGIKQ